MANRFDRTADMPDEPDTLNDSGGPEAFGRLQSQLEELAEYARLYVSAKKDAILATVRKLALFAVAGILAFLIGSALLVTAAVIALLGLAQLIGAALGDRLWAGYLITGFGLLALVAIVLAVAIFAMQRRFRKQTVEKYAKRHKSQRARFGHDVVGQAANGSRRS
jgi:hypothetical protein